ncbi:MAG: hypothetical protein ACOCX1_01335 [Fimbriimonadaceae bacterium]
MDENTPTPLSEQVQRQRLSACFITLGVAGVVGLFVVVLLAFILYPVFTDPAWGQAETSIERLRKAGRALHLYSADHDDRLPTESWMSDLEPYVDSREALLAPGAESYGFAMQQGLPGRRLEQIVPKTVAIFDSSVIERNAVAPLSTMPDPARYGNVNTLVRVSGEVVSVRPADIPDLQ